MEKKGISQITGKTEIKLGEKVFYKVSRIHRMEDHDKVRNASWKIYVKEKGNWRELKPSPSSAPKKGDQVSYTILNQALVGKELLVEAYIYKPEKTTPPGLKIKVVAGTEKKIQRVELFMSNDTPIKEDTILKYNQTIKVKVYTLNMPNEILKLTLYEDDADGAGHNPKNEKNKVAEKTKSTNERGFLWHEFKLKAEFSKIANAMMDGSHDKLHEYYVLVESEKNGRKSSKNVELENPDYVVHQTYDNGKVIDHKKDKIYNGGVIEEVVIKGKYKKQMGIDPIPKTGRSVSIVNEPPEKKKEEICDCKKYDLVWGDKVSCEFRKKVVEICADLWGEDNKIKMANGLMAVIYVESSTTFSASKIELKPTGKLKSNGKPIFAYRGLTKEEILNLDENFSGAVGLIQFTPTAINALNKQISLNLTKRKLALMTEMEQLDYVKKYFKLDSANTKIKTPEDIYLHVFAPKGVNKSEDYVLYEKHTNPTTKQEKTDNRNYNANASVDNENNNDGKIQRSEILGRYRSSFAQGLTNKETTFICSANLEKKEQTSCICHKKHIDLSDKIKWQTQFDPQWGNKKKQNVACWKTSQQILTNSGLGKLSGYPDGYIGLAKEVNKHTKLEYMSDGVKEAIKYIDSELEKGHPVLIGVNHDLNYRGEGNNDHTTDHFVVIIGRGCDTKPFYLFYDVGTRYKAKGASDSNKLYVYENKIEGKTAYDSSKNYTVAQVRKNR